MPWPDEQEVLVNPLHVFYRHFDLAAQVVNTNHLTGDTMR